VFIYQSRFLRRGEVWFDNEPDGRRVDWILYRQRSAPVPKSRWRFFYTRLIDLSKSSTELLAEMDKTTISKIAQAAEKDKISWEQNDPRDSAVMDELEAMWNQFTASKRTVPLNRDWLDKMIEAGALDLTVARDRAANLLTCQATYQDKARAQQLIVVSPYRANPDISLRRLTNRANCFLHWNVILRMKERGIRYFDFGGWYTGTTDINLLGINLFKKSFGGQVIREYQCEQAVTAKGWLGLTMARVLKKPNR
jgi:hypothetical protein